MPAPEPLVKAEPVALLDLVKVAISVAGYFGVTVPEDTAAKVIAGAIALYAFIQATWLTRAKVTPVARADATAAALAELQKDALFREAKAYDDGVAVGEHERPVRLADLAPQPPFVPRPEAKPPAGLYVPDEAISETDGPTVASPRPVPVGLPIDWGNADDISLTTRRT